MAAFEVIATALCFFESELKEPGRRFWLTDIKDVNGNVLMKAEDQFSEKCMKRADAPVKVGKTKTAAQAQAIADQRVADDAAGKAATAESAVKISELPSADSPL